MTARDISVSFLPALPLLLVLVCGFTPVPSDTSHAFHRITESLSLEKNFKSIESNPEPNMAKPPLNRVPKHHVYTSFKDPQEWGLNPFPGQPVPVLDNPFGEESFPNIQSKSPLAQHAMAS